MSSRIKYFYYYGGDERIPATETPHNSLLFNKSGSYPISLYESVKDLYPKWAAGFPEKIETKSITVYKQIINYCNGKPTILLNEPSKTELNSQVKDSSKLVKVEYNTKNIAQIWINDSQQEDISRLVKAHLEHLKGNPKEVENAAMEYIKYIGTEDNRLKNFFQGYPPLQSKVSAMYKNSYPPTLFNTKVRPRLIEHKELSSSSETATLKAKLEAAENEIQMLRNELKKKESSEHKKPIDNSAELDQISERLKEIAEKEEELRDREAIIEVKQDKFKADRKEFMKREKDLKAQTKAIEKREKELREAEEKLAADLQEAEARLKKTESAETEAVDTERLKELQKKVERLQRENAELRIKNEDAAMSVNRDTMITKASTAALGKEDRAIVDEALRQAEYYMSRLEKSYITIRRLEERCRFLEQDASARAEELSAKKGGLSDEEKDAVIAKLEEKNNTLKMKLMVEHSKLVSTCAVLDRVTRSELFVTHLQLQKKMKRSTVRDEDDGPKRKTESDEVVFLC